MIGVVNILERQVEGLHFTLCTGETVKVSEPESDVMRGSLERF